METYLITDRTWELISAFQKFIRRNNELDAMRVFFELESNGHFNIAINRLQIIAHEDIGIGDKEAVLFALRSIDDAREFYKKKNDAWRLMVSNAVLSLARAKKSRIADYIQFIARGKNNESKIEIPDYALDKHTKRGKQLGRGLDHFRNVASLITPVADIINEYEEEAYYYWSKITEKPEPETLFKPIVKEVKDPSSKEECDEFRKRKELFREQKEKSK